MSVIALNRNRNILGAIFNNRGNGPGYINRRQLLRSYRMATSTFFFIAGITFASWASRIPDIQAKLRLSEAGLGGILFALPAGLMTSLPISGFLVGKFGSKRLMLFGSICYPLTLLLLSVVPSVWLLVAGLFFFGLFANVINIAMNTQAVAVENLYGKSIMASFHGLWSVAGFAGAALGTLFVSSNSSPVIHFAIILAFCLLLAAIAFSFTLSREYGSEAKTKMFVKPDREIWLLGMIAFCCLLCEGAMADWSGVYFKKVVDAPAKYITVGYLAFTSTMALGRFTGDWLVTRLGVRRMLQLSGAFITLGLLLSVMVPTLAIAATGFLLVGFGVSSVIPIVYGAAGRSATMSPSTALATVSTIGFLGFLVGPPLIGFIAQATSLQASFIVIAILGSGTALLSGKLKKH